MLRTHRTDAALFYASFLDRDRGHRGDGRDDRHRSSRYDDRDRERDRDRYSRRDRDDRRDDKRRRYEDEPPRRDFRGRDDGHHNGRSQRIDRDEFNAPPPGERRGRRPKDTTGSPDRRSPTPDGAVAISQRKRRATGWDVHAPGYEQYTALQAKMTGADWTTQI